MPAASTPPQLIPAIDTRKSRRSNSHTKLHRHPAPPHPASWPESSLRSPLRAIAAMRRPVLIFLIFNLALVAFLVHSVWTLLELLVIDGVEDAITKAELPPVGEEHGQVTRPMIPKIIHQTYINTSIPLVWQDAQRSCLELHKEPEWKYMLWTDAMSDDFIKKEYPDFLDTFRGYQYPIQRADAIRYFVLEHFGGIYIDLDDGCNRSLEPLLKYPAFVRKTIPTGVSNDAMGSVPGHPFFQRVIEELPNYDRSWILPYISVMASTGPLFVSIIWRHYSDEGFNVGDGPSGGRVRIIFPQEYQNQPWSFFTHHLGNSWHGYDVQLIFWLARNWVLVTIFGFVFGFGLIFFAWWYYHRYYLTPSEIPRWKTKPIRQRLPFWSRRAQSEYELINRHEP